MTTKRERGRINPIIALGCLGVAVIVILMFMSSSSPEAAGERFMRALAAHDVRTLTEMSHLEKPERPLAEQWDECVNKRAKNYMFVWVWEGFHTEGTDAAVGKLHLVEFPGPEPKDSETFELPLLLVDGNWKVDLASLSRKFFPALPR
jgi:hypothetical protein